MAEYIVEMRGECREVYIVEADSEAEARENWMNGSLQVQEGSSMEIYDVREDS
jgi:hypothetical protein